jgi:hypothetical protein
MKKSPVTNLKQGGTIRKSRLGVRADVRRSSPADDLEVDTRDNLLRNRNRPTPPTSTRSKVIPLQTHRSAPVTSSSSGMSDAIDQDQGQGTPPRKRYRTSSPLFPPGSPVASHMSSDRPITPVPDYVLDIHRRLCGREFVRHKSPVSGGQGSPAKLKSKKTKRERDKERDKRMIDERAHDRALERRRNREKENEHRLVVGSSQSHAEEESPKHGSGKRKRVYSPVPDIPRLAPMVVNTIHHTPTMRIDDKSRTGVRNEVSDINAYNPSAVYKELCRSPSPIPTDISLRSRQLRRIPTGTSPRSAIPITSPSPSPAPKSLTPVQNSLGPPARDFEAVPMHAETLLSWGGETRTPIRPEPKPLQHRDVPEEADPTETQSVCTILPF